MIIHVQAMTSSWFLDQMKKNMGFLERRMGGEQVSCWGKIEIRPRSPLKMATKVAT